MFTVEFGSSLSNFTLWQPQRGRIFDAFAYDVETTEIDDSRPDQIPQVVLATAYDGHQGVFIRRDDLLSFFEAHGGVPFIGHNVAYDLAVSQQLFGEQLDIYQAVEDKQVWCTLVLHRLLELATNGNSARDKCSLAHCVEQHLGSKLSKDVQDAHGKQVRLNFGEYLGRDLSEIPPEYLQYAAADTMATWSLFHVLKRKIREVLIRSDRVFGYVDEDWLSGVMTQFGPLTHHLQLRVSIVLDSINRQGLCVERQRHQSKLAEVTAAIQDSEKRLQQAGFVVRGPGSSSALQRKLQDFHDRHLEVPLKTTKSGKWSSATEDLAMLSKFDPGFQLLSDFRGYEKHKSTYLDKMNCPAVYPRFRFLASTGRTSCGGGFNLQSLPREDQAEVGSSIRGCFVPRPGNVFIDSDYSQIELVVLGYIWKSQMEYGHALTDLIDGNRDLHREIASLVLNKPVGEITKSERAAAKPVSFGRPGGMGVKSLQEYARNTYGQNLTVAQVEQTIEAYRQLCPEMDEHLQDEVNNGAVLAEWLQMTPAEYKQAMEGGYLSTDHDEHSPQDWLGGMLLKVLRDPRPETGKGRPYTAQELEYFWGKAQTLIDELPKKWEADILGRTPSRELWEVVRNWAGKRPVFTVTGRLRAGARFSSSRNNLFQGPTADGAICALWALWRAGYRIVAFIHDQFIVECPADDRVLERKADIERLLIQGMHTVIPEVLVKVETVITRSLNKKDLDPRYYKETTATAA